MRMTFGGTLFVNNIASQYVLLDGTNNYFLSNAGPSGIWSITCWGTPNAGTGGQLGILIATSLTSTVDQYPTVGTNRIVARNNALFTQQATWTGFVPNGVTISCAFFGGVTAVSTERGGLSVHAIPQSGPHAALQASGTTQISTGLQYAVVWSFATLQSGSHGFSSANFAADGKITVPQNGLYKITFTWHTATVATNGAIYLNYYSSATLTTYTGTSRVLGLHSSQGRANGNTVNAIVYLTTTDYVVCVSITGSSAPDLTTAYTGLSIVKLPQTS
jgi:hypothetical protein